MKLTEENLKIGMAYIVKSGETDKIKPGDHIMVEYSHTTDPDEGSFTVIRWARPGEKRNKIWPWRRLDNLFEILDPFEFEINKKFAMDKIQKYIKEIARISENYFLRGHDSTERLHLNIIDKIAKSLANPDILDENNYKDNWLLKNFINPDGTIKNIKTEESEE